MGWTDRIKLCWQTFIRCAGPLYGWLLIFGFGGGIVSFLIALGVFLSAPEKIQLWTDLGRDISENAVTSFQSLWTYLSPFFTLLFLLSALFLILTSIHMTGAYNIIRKGYREKTSFTDFSLKGFVRILLLMLIYFAVFLVLLAIYIVFALLFSPGWHLLIFTVIYSLGILAFCVFLLPLLSILSFYLIHHTEWGFGETLGMCWKFFRQNMGNLWSMVGFLALIQVVILILGKYSDSLSAVLNLLVAPFIMTTMGTWVLSLEETAPPIPPPSQSRPANPPNPPDSSPSSNPQTAPASPTTANPATPVGPDPIKPADPQNPENS